MERIKQIIEEENKKILQDYPELNISLETLEEIACNILELNNDDELVKDFRNSYRRELKNYFMENLKDDTILTDDPVSDYLKKIGMYPLLTKEEEIELSKKIKNGDEAARMKMIESNLRLSVYMARKNHNYAKYPLDLIQAANIGLIIATDKFDGDKNCRFSTYAIWWIKRELRKYSLISANNIQISVKEAQELSQIHAMKVEFEDLNGRTPTNKEISQKLGISIEKVRDLRSIYGDTISLNTPIGNGEEDTELLLMVPDDTITPFDTDLIRDDHSVLIEEMLLRSKLTEVQKDIIRHKYGICGAEKLSQKQLAQKLNRTQVWVNLQEHRAFSKLRLLSRYYREQL